MKLEDLVIPHVLRSGNRKPVYFHFFQALKEMLYDLYIIFTSRLPALTVLCSSWHNGDRACTDTVETFRLTSEHQSVHYLH